MTVIIGIDPHKASHTAVAISAAEEPLGELRVRACAAQAERLLAWAAAWPQRIWAVEGAGGLGHLLAGRNDPQGQYRHVGRRTWATLWCTGPLRRGVARVLLKEILPDACRRDA